MAALPALLHLLLLTTTIATLSADTLVFIYKLSLSPFSLFIVLG